MKLQPKDNDDVEIDMSPMIDMVFLLLIFFIVASTVIDEKVPIEDIPMAVNSSIPENKGERAIISVNKDEEVFYGIRNVPLTLDDLKLHLKAAIAENEKLRVMIRSDGNVRYEMNEKIMKICGEVGATDLIYAAYEGGEEGS